MAVGTALGDQSPERQRMIMSALGAGAQFGLLLPYSRSHESEADRIGLLLMAVAGYDPREAAEFWGRMSQQSGGKAPPEFASTHPAHSTRINDIRKWLAEALPLYQQSRPQPDHPLPRT
jgi:predicted Zn-dependent protease